MTIFFCVVTTEIRCCESTENQAGCDENNKDSCRIVENLWPTPRESCQQTKTPGEGEWVDGGGEGIEIKNQLSQVEAKNWG